VGALAAALLVLLAGCSAPFAPMLPEEPTAGGLGSLGTATPGGPWGGEIVVGIDAGPDDPDRVAAAAREAARYWDEHAERYVGHPVSIRVLPDAAVPPATATAGGSGTTGPSTADDESGTPGRAGGREASTELDVVIRVGEGVPSCSGVADAVGCAPLINDSRQIDRPETVWLRSGLSDDSAALVLTHEFGHLLGLDHEDAPADVMAARTVLYTRPQPNASEVAFPWADREFTVHVAVANASEPVRARWQVRYALRYFERNGGRPGVPANLTFTTVENASGADVVIRTTAVSPCGSGAGSCGETRGPDPDGDGAVESYDRLTITLVDLDERAVGWHVGYWLAFGLGAERDAEKPAPFRDASYDERRSRWWEADDEPGSNATNVGSGGGIGAGVGTGVGPPRASRPTDGSG